MDYYETNYHNPNEEWSISNYGTKSMVGSI